MGGGGGSRLASPQFCCGCSLSPRDLRDTRYPHLPLSLTLLSLRPFGSFAPESKRFFCVGMGRSKIPDGTGVSLLPYLDFSDPRFDFSSLPHPQ